MTTTDLPTVLPADDRDDDTSPSRTGALAPITRDDLVARAEADPQRPRFHFVAPAGWLNDPNGLTQWNGVYHLFYQYNPVAPVHDRIHWGHATSRDLVTWTDEPVALAPGESGPDREGCWSGVLVDDGGTPTLVYSGRHDGRELPCVATGSADLRTWARHDGNPVIRETPEGLDVPAFRDHCVWQEDGTWRHLVGSGIRGRGGAALLYESQDLREWRYVGPLVVGDSSVGLEGDPDWTGTMWECVDLFRPPTGGGVPQSPHVLVFSAWHDGATHHPLYLTGDYEGDTFTPAALHRLDLGGRFFYAPQSFSDDRGRRILFGWLQEGRPDADAVANGWTGVMSLPRQAVLGADGELHLSPVEEVASLRGAGDAVLPRRLAPGEAVELTRGDQVDVELALVLEPGAAVEVRVRATDDDRESTTLEVTRHADGPGGTVRLDRSRSSLDASVDATERGGQVPVGDDGSVAVRVLVDHSALEVFVNGRALTARVYPTRPDATRCAVSVVTGAARLVQGASWTMRDVWDGERQLWPAP